ncbi:MAG: ribonucleotide reductase N-terminal alpha domain-containing protein [Chitinophagales bacterium]
MKSAMGLELSKNAISVLEKRYLKKQNGRACETPEDMFRRVAWNIAEVEHTVYGKSAEEADRLAQQFYDFMTRLEFVPNSPTLMNAGRDLQQLAACFVLPVEDSMAGIFDSIKYAAMIHQSGGGTGFSFSRLRPKNDEVRTTGGVASGPISFMKVFNAATDAVKQGGTRRGANMGILRVDHPDILEFITAKEKNNDLTNFNISVAVTDRFMEALANDGEYELINPRNGQVVKTLRAKEVFDLIVEGAWKNGEPGIVFIDRINEHNPTPNLGAIESTNPCVVGDALVSTGEGLVRMERLVADVADQEVWVATDDRVLGLSLFRNGTDQAAAAGEGVTFHPVARAFRSGVKPVVRVTTESGYALEVTPDHKIMTTLGWVPAAQLKPGYHSVLLQSGASDFPEAAKLPFEPEREHLGRNGRSYRLNLPEEWSEELGLVLGWLVGDGWLREGDRNCRVGFTFAEADREALDLVVPAVNRWYGRDVASVRRANGVVHHSYHSHYLVEFFRRLGVRGVKAAEKRVPEALYTASRGAVRGFLRALFTADGTLAVTPNQTAYASLTAKSPALLGDVQRLLLALGIKSRIHDRSRSPRTGFEYQTVAGEKRCHERDGVLYELQVSREDLGVFLDEVGFIGAKHAGKIAALKGRRRGFYARAFADRVAAVTPVGEREVYDLTEPVTHSFVANGVVVSNCGEQPLLPYEACNLGSINLAKMVEQVGDRAEVDYERLDRVVRLAVRFLDDVIDASKYPLPVIDEMVKSNRKIGLGVMGFADFLIKLGVRYDSDAAVKLAEEVMGFIQKTAHDASADLAEERGAFPNFKGSALDVPGERPRRNATCTTIAPTGTISIIAGCSSGIEPLFAVCFVRNVLDNQKLVEVNPLFEEIARREGFYTPQLMEKIAEHGSLEEVEEVPERYRRLFVTAHQITPEWHINLQAAFQRFTDNAVSKTINFSHEASREDVAQSYLMAYRKGCKGVTVYRDGSREEQVLTAGTKVKEVTSVPEPVAAAAPAPSAASPTYPTQIVPRPRPQVTTGTTEKVQVGCGNLYVSVNADEYGICEVFTNTGREGGCASQSEATSRLISIALRSGISVETIYEQLRGIRCPACLRRPGVHVTSCPDAISKAIKKYVERNGGSFQPGLPFGKLPGAGLASAIRAEQEAAAQKAAAAQPAPKCQDSTGEGPAGPPPAAAEVAASGDGFHESLKQNRCPECGQPLNHESGCIVCVSCGYSKCG